MNRTGERTRLLVMATVVLGMVTMPSTSSAGVPDREVALQIFNRDVFFIDGSTLRNPTGATDPGERLFSVVGSALDLTWGEWQEASAKSVALVIGGPNNPRTQVHLNLTDLVPGGLYSVFYGTLGPDSEHPLCQGVERTLPLSSFGAPVGPDPSSFRADTAGAATYRGRADGDLLEADQVFFSIIYHFDDVSYHPMANRGQSFTQGEGCRSTYGHDAMRHLLVLQKF